MTTVEIRGRIGPRALEDLLGTWANGGQSAYEALADRIRLLIIDGRLPTGTRLPAERELAETLGRSRTTIVSAYRQLRETGHLVSVRGSGSATMLPPTPLPAGPEPHDVVVDFARAAPAAISGLENVVERATRNIGTVLTKTGFDLVGSVELRERIAAHYAARGLPTSADEIMITLGAQHAIALVSRTLLRPADRVLVESPTYPHALDAFRGAGGRLVTTPVTTRGWDLDQLRDTLERVRPALAYLQLDFQNPTGASMPPDQRDDVIRAARRTGTVIVIDDTTADLDLGRGWTDVPFAARADTAVGGRSSGHAGGARSPRTHAAGQPAVITLGSLGKSVWGGLRIGWVRADGDVLRSLRAARAASDLGNPELEQLIACEVFDDYPALLERRIAQLRHQRDVLVGELRSRMPSWDVPVPDGGASLWVGLGAPISSTLALFGLTRGVHVIAGPRFGADGAFERFARIPYTLSAEDLVRGVHALADTARALPALPLPAGTTQLAEVV
ncbi:PLP-dependent aminotransferase family protein [Jiangella asiatica]|uniref:PLP-dependent aminotransferase family protein n=1 Tax=Jiangella asiatica TaxID=2530372 RepID=A0A4R5CC48_9ACTN|nr:PLP-dependent aminotransferase family protein [Jiangella asiatica]TDD95803.1 PLP-dependent aminotransferase family protein [Jiangella asiatica]